MSTTNLRRGRNAQNMFCFFVSYAALRHLTVDKKNNLIKASYQKEIKICRFNLYGVKRHVYVGFA